MSVAPVSAWRAGRATTREEANKTNPVSRLEKIYSQKTIELSARWFEQMR